VQSKANQEDLLRLQVSHIPGKLEAFKPVDTNSPMNNNQKQVLKRLDHLQSDMNALQGKILKDL
jgi:hypothetical protein